MAEYPYTESGSFRVRPYRPGRTIALTVVLTAAFFGGLWWMYGLGYERGNADARMSRATEARLRIQIDDLRNRVGELTDETTLLERSRQIDQGAFTRLEDQLERREQRISHLEEELAFYRSLVSSADAEGGLTIERFSLLSQGDNEYQYELVLTRLDHDDTELSGDVDLSISGVDDSGSTTLELGDLLAGDHSMTSFDFKYFQALSGRVRLPDGVEPETFHVRVQPDDDSVDGVEEDFAWNSLVTGGS